MTRRRRSGPRGEELRIERRDSLALEIQAVLEEDLQNGARLMLPRYRAQALKHTDLDGYCAVAAAAYFFLGGKREAGLQPMQRTWSKRRSKGSHWWIVKDETTVVDLTLRPKDPSPDFEYKGRPRGFMQTGYRRPSKRARELMDRVERQRHRRRRGSQQV